MLFIGTFDFSEVRKNFFFHVFVVVSSISHKYACVFICLFAVVVGVVGLALKEA